MDGGSNGRGNGLRGEFNKLYLPDITESWYIYQVFRNLLPTNCYLFLLGCNVGSWVLHPLTVLTSLKC